MLALLITLCLLSSQVIYVHNYWAKLIQGPSWLWSYGRWIYNYLCNQCPSPLTLRVWIPLRRGVLDTTLCDKVCQLLVAGLWFSPVSFTNKTDHHDITEILLIVELNTKNQTKPNWYKLYMNVPLVNLIRIFDFGAYHKFNMAAMANNTIWLVEL
jgi:hypothetical protein